MGLFAHCAARSVNAVHDGKREYHQADALARALKLKMADYWQPTPANFLAASARGACWKRCARAQMTVGLKW